MAKLREQLFEAFRAYDRNHTGFICSDNISHVLKGLSMDGNLVDGVLKGFNAHDADLIEYKEFLCWFMDEGEASRNESIQSTYAINQVLGAGAYGTVHAATHLASGAIHAVKTINVLKEDDQAVKDEISIMRDIDHSNIVHLLDVFHEQESVHIVMEMCSGGTLLDRMVDTLGFSEPQAALVNKQIMSGISHFHGLCICHRDLKPQNILFQEATLPVEHCTVKISDFGLAKRFTADQVFTKPIGSPSYAAPEVLLGEYRHTCDMWSAGVIAYVTLSSCPPFQGKDDVEVLGKVMEGRYSFDGPRWSTTSAEAKDFVSRLMEIQPSVRCTAVQALQHDWLRVYG